MTKTELIDAVAEKTGATKKDTGEIVNSLFDTIQAALEDQEKVQIIGFGTFETRDRASRKGRNPQTGESLVIPARTVPAFRAGKTLKEAVDK